MLGPLRNLISLGRCRHFPEPRNSLVFFSTASSPKNCQSLELEEVQKVLSDVKADDVRVIHVGDKCDWTNHIVIATGRSTWHVKNIAQALLHKAGTVIVHALDEKARAYYDLESHLSKGAPKGSIEDLEKAFVKVRPVNNSKKKSAKNVE